MPRPLHCYCRKEGQRSGSKYPVDEDHLGMWIYCSIIEFSVVYLHQQKIPFNILLFLVKFDFWLFSEVKWNHLNKIKIHKKSNKNVLLNMRLLKHWSIALPKIQCLNYSKLGLTCWFDSYLAILLCNWKSTDLWKELRKHSCHLERKMAGEEN